MTQVNDNPAPEDDADKRLMQRAETLQVLLYMLGAFAIGVGGGIGAWKLEHWPWPFLSLPLIGVAAGIPWVSTLLIDEHEARRMGVQAFRNKLSQRFIVGAVCGAVAAVIAVVVMACTLLWWSAG